MPRYRYLDSEGEEEVEVTLADGAIWSETVLDDMENANWHTERHVFEMLMMLLPDIYKAINPRLQKRLQKAVDAWDMEF